MNKEICDECNNIAIWFYGPGSEKYCDDCVPRGCTCEIHAIHEIEYNDNDNLIFWSKEDYEKSEFNTLLDIGKKTYDDTMFYYSVLDDKNRFYPCCEYLYFEDGYSDDED